MSTAARPKRAQSVSPLAPNRPEDVLAHIPPGADLIVPPAAGEPVTLLDTLKANYRLLDGVRIHGMDPARERAYIRGEVSAHLRHVDYYLGPASRQAYWDGGCDLVPNNFSEMPAAHNSPVGSAQTGSSTRDLGIHTEALSDGLMDLVESGAATRTRKRQYRKQARRDLLHRHPPPIRLVG